MSPDTHRAIDERTCAYDVLGIARDAPYEEIRRAYRRMAVRFHPDKNPDGREMFELVSRAYEAVRDEERRSRYDAYGFAGVEGRARRGCDAADAADETRGARRNGRRTTADDFDGRGFFSDPFETFKRVFGDDGFGRHAQMMGMFGSFGRDPFAGESADSVFRRRRSIFDDVDSLDDWFGDGSGRDGGGFHMGRTSAFSSTSAFGGRGVTWSTSTSTTTTIGADGVRRSRTVSRRTLPDGTVVETENVTHDAEPRRDAIGTGGSGHRFLNHHW
jgi:curved DNA-binding protein CbpA